MKQQAENRSHMRLRRIKHIHFVGIGGAGMCGIAEVLFNLGYQVSGSDIATNRAIEHLRALGIKVFLGHRAEYINSVDVSVDVIVVSSAIDQTNPEISAARAKHLPVVPRAVMLAELMRYSYGIAIAGCHGKTTTTSLVASILGHAGLDPTFIIGGILKSHQFNSSLGTSNYMVVEADESDASFLHLLPMISVVTNIDQDHMGTYNHDLTKLKQTYLEFLHKLPFYGLAVICIDDPLINEVVDDIGRPILTYGLNEQADYRASAIKQLGMQTHFQLHMPDTGLNAKAKNLPVNQSINQSINESINIVLNLVGEHNVLNALAAIAVADELGIAIEDIQTALAEFKGVARRFDIRTKFYMDKSDPDALVYTAQYKPRAAQSEPEVPEPEAIILVDDYGHHPREIELTIATARKSWPQKRIVMLFQPHRYSRTRDFYDNFVTILAETDILILLDIYPANEQPLPGISSQALAASIRQRCNKDPIYLADPGQLQPLLDNLLQPGDILITQGAGDVGSISTQLTKHFRQPA